MKTKQKKPTFTLVYILTAVFVIAMVIHAARADAHVPTVTADCRVLEVTLTDYEPHSSVSIGVDGATSTYTFTGSFHKSIPWNAAVAHQWLVRVDNKGDGKSDQWDHLWTGTTTPCVPPTTAAPTTTYGPPKVEAFNPATPPCVLDGHLDANSPECASLASPVMNPPVVLDRTVTPAADTPVVLAFTGSHSQNRAVVAAALIGVGLLTYLASRRFGKVI